MEDSAQDMASASTAKNKAFNSPQSNDFQRQDEKRTTPISIKPAPPFSDQGNYPLGSKLLEKEYAPSTNTSPESSLDIPARGVLAASAAALQAEPTRKRQRFHSAKIPPTNDGKRAATSFPPTKRKVVTTHDAGAIGQPKTAPPLQTSSQEEEETEATTVPYAEKQPVAVEPNDNDVLFGRGKLHMKRPGNRMMQRLVESNRMAYDQADREDKTDIAWQIVKTIQERGGRFLKRNAVQDIWYEVPDESARNKISHGFRDARAKSGEAQKVVPVPPAADPNRAAGIGLEINTRSAATTAERIAQFAPFLMNHHPLQRRPPAPVQPQLFAGVSSNITSNPALLHELLRLSSAQPVTRAAQNLSYYSAALQRRETKDDSDGSPFQKR